MGFRFRKSVKAGPVRINFSKSGAGYSVGGKGFRYTKKAGGGSRTTASIPGTGIAYTQDYGKKNNHKSTNARQSTSTPIARTSPTEVIKEVRPKNTLTELLLCIFLGIFGAHRFYTRKWGTAVLYLFTGGIFYIGWAVDLIRIIIRFIKDRKAVENSAEPVILDSAPEPTVLSADPAPELENLPEPIAVPIPAPAEKTPVVPTQPKRDYVQKTHKVTGIQYYEKNLLNLASETDEWAMSKRELVDDLRVDERVWRYEFFPENVELVPEPTNPHDENAIKVVVDGEHVGYIKAGSCKSLLKLIAEDRILSISCTIGGGPYKIIYEDINDNGDEVYKLEKDNTNFFVTLHVLEKTTEK